jgi:polyprenyldihydroxybenzoate methyltransferase/3-demethylubiquinol 3-O-methyltransferase
MLAARQSLAWGSAEGCSSSNRQFEDDHHDHRRDVGSIAASAGADRRTSDTRASSSVNRAESDKFAKLASSWWDPAGPFKPLHAMNRARCEFIKGVIEDYIAESGESEESGPRSELRILDVGCGGGILSESLAAMTFRDRDLDVRVLGIDVNQEGIDAATAHRDAAHPPLPASRLAYKATSIEELLEREPSEQFDVTISSEVIEHVDHPHVFCQNLIRATAPGGRIIISTLNRTVKSYGLAIVAAETLLRLVPEGTHDWSKFLTPEEVLLMMTTKGSSLSPAAAAAAPDEAVDEVSLDSMAGMLLNPLTGLWRLDGDDVDVNYIQAYKKKR